MTDREIVLEMAEELGCECYICECGICECRICECHISDWRPKDRDEGIVVFFQGDRATSLHLVDEALVHVPKIVGELSKLKCLGIYSLCTCKLPESISKLGNLEILIAWEIELPEWIGNLSKLKQLKINSVECDRLPQSIGKLTELLRLNIELSGIKELPDSIGNLINLRSLNIAYTKINEFPDSIGNLVNLRSLNIANTEIKELPDSVCNLTALELLDMGFTEITKLPKSFANLSKLSELDIPFAARRILPETMPSDLSIRYTETRRKSLIMNIEIESRESMEERINEPFPARTALISIADTDTDFVALKNKPEYILQMKFDDVCSGDFEDFLEQKPTRGNAENLHIFSDKQAEEIAVFVKSILGKAELLICQCEYGQSRSAGIAAAIRQYLYGCGIEIFADERYYPNKLVYKKVLAKLENGSGTY